MDAADPRLLSPGDVLDFWRVLLADRVAGRLILYAEMKVPGEAWLEFQVSERELVQTATFRPRGLYGRAYWYLCFPFHLLLFPQMARQLADRVKRDEELLAPEMDFWSASQDSFPLIVMTHRVALIENVVRSG